MNFACESLVPGEMVLQTLWQPELRQRAAAAFGLPIYRTVLLAHLTILTDKELILIWDDERTARKAGKQYGGVWRYVPLRHFVSASWGERDDGFLTLSLGLTSDGRIERVFAAASRDNLGQFQREAAKLIQR